jgi:hypothetical protein
LEISEQEQKKKKLRRVSRMKTKVFVVLVVITAFFLPAYAMAQTTVGVGVTTNTGVTANPNQSITSTSYGAPLPEYVQPAQIAPLPSSAGLPTPAFTQLPVGSNVPSIVRDVLFMRQVWASKVKLQLQRAGGPDHLLLNSITPAKDLELEKVGEKEILVLPGMPLALPVAERFSFKGTTPDAGKKKEPVGTTPQCLYAGILYSASRSGGPQRVLVVESMGFDSGTRSDVSSKLWGIAFGGGMTGGGVTGVLGFGGRRDGASFRAEVDPYVHFAVYDVTEAQYRKLLNWQMANMRSWEAKNQRQAAGVGQSGVGSAVDKLLQAAQAMENAARTLRDAQIEELRKAAVTTTKK